MDKHWSNFCTMSIVHFMAYPQCLKGEGPIAATVAKIAEDPFFTGIEIGWIKDPAERAAVKQIVDAAHIKVGYAGQSALLVQQLNLNSLDEEARGRAVAQVKSSIDEAAELGSERVAFLTGRDPGDADRPAALEALHKSTARALPLRAGAGDRAHLRGVRPRHRQEMPDRPQRVRGGLRPRGAA